MRIGLNLGDTGWSVAEHRDLLRAADQLGCESIWVGESYGSDAVSAMGAIAAVTERVGIGSAILQLHARTPAATAMTAIGLDHISSGRFRLGLGVSGPGVVEGWHGVPYGKPLARTREQIDIIRSVLAGERLRYDGEYHQVPYAGPGATGLGKPIKSNVPPYRPDVPIYLAAVGPRNIELAGAVADGWLPIFYSPAHEEALVTSFDAGIEGAGRSPADVEVVANPPLVAGPDLAACRDEVRPHLALYVGGMGPRGRNFYFNLACRYGFEGAATTIQDLYLDGRRDEAAAAVPDDLVDAVALVGPWERIAEQLDGVGSVTRRRPVRPDHRSRRPGAPGRSLVNRALSRYPPAGLGPP